MAKPIRILWVVGYIPGKLGSFEDFMAHAARRFAACGYEMYFVFRGEPLVAFETQLQALGAKVFVLPMRSRLDPIFIRELCRLIARERIDVLHSNFDLANFSCSAAAALTRVPIYVWHQHNYMGHDFSIARWLIVKFVNQVADRVFCVTDTMRQHLLQKGFAVAKVQRLYIGPNLDKFVSAKGNGDDAELKTALHIPDGARVVTSVGDARPEKGQLYLVRAFAQVLKEFANSFLLLVGARTGASSAQVQAEADRLGIADRVRLTEMRSDVPRIVGMSDLVVVPPTEEVSVLAIMEAMAAAKPVVVSRIGGIPEVVSHGETGFLVPPADVAELASAIGTLLQDQELSMRMGIEGRRVVEAKFSMGQAVEKLAQAYEELLRAKAKPATLRNA